MEDCNGEAVIEAENVESRSEADLKGSNGEKVKGAESLDSKHDATLVSERGVLSVLSLRHVVGPAGRREVRLVGQEDLLDYMLHTKVCWQPLSYWWNMVVWSGNRMKFGTLALAVALLTLAQVEDRMCKKDKGSDVQRKVSCWPCTVVIESVQVCLHLPTWSPGFLVT